MNPLQKIKTPTVNSAQKIELTAKDLILTLVFLLIFVAIYFSDYFIQLANDTSLELSESRQVSKRMADISLEIDKLNIDTTILSTPFLKTSTPLPSYPLDMNAQFAFGKSNPFTGSYIVTATTSNLVGGARYTSQTSTSTNIITTTPSTTSTRR